MLQATITKNFGFLQICMIFVVVCFVLLFNGNFVFGQEVAAEEEEASEPTVFGYELYDLLNAIAPYAAIAGSALIGPWIVKKWKARESEIERQRKDLERKIELEQKEVELKIRIAGEISERVMRILVAIMKVEEFLSRNRQQYAEEELKVSRELRDLKDARNQEYFNEFKVKSHLIQSEIQAYFKECLRAWNVLIDYVQFVEQLSDEVNSKKRKTIIIDKHLKNKKHWNEYEPLEPKVKDDKLVFRDLLDKAMKKFEAGNPNNKEVKQFKERHPTEQFNDIKSYTDMLADKEVEAWYGVKHAIVDEKDKIITNILKSECHLFHPEISYHTVEEFCNKLKRTGEYYIDSKAKKIQCHGDSLFKKLSDALNRYQSEKGNDISLTGKPESNEIVQNAVRWIYTARLYGVVKERRVFPSIRMKFSPVSKEKLE